MHHFKKPNPIIFERPIFIAHLTDSTLPGGLMTPACLLRGANDGVIGTSLKKNSANWMACT